MRVRVIFATLCCCCWLATAGQSLIVNELMIDPTPSRGLPLAEYVELINTSRDTVDLQEWAIASGGRPVGLTRESVLLPPGKLLLLVDDGYRDSFPTADRLLEINLPGLSNTGDEVSLLRHDSVQYFVAYTDDWYQDGERDDGGYSLAYVGGAADCPGSWRASREPVGGSPGLPNRDTGVPADDRAPILTAREVYADSIVLRFSEAVEGAPGDLLEINGLPILSNWMNEVTLVGYGNFSTQRIDSVTLLPDYRDCSGNVPPRPLTFAVILPTDIRTGELLISELLFDPVSGGSDYVEIYNNSTKPLDLNGLQLTNPVSSARVIKMETTLLLPPGGYAVVTPDTTIFTYWPDVRADRLILTSLPSFPNAGGEVVLLGRAGQLLDRMVYGEEMHNDLLADPEGVALERLSFEELATAVSNWTSASSLSGYGTPTLPNSQSLTGTEENEVALRYRTFSPDGDGYRDRMTLTYTLAEPGTYATVEIFDAGGRPVRRLTDIDLLGTEGELYWDGRRNSGELAAAGPYVVLLQLFTTSGHSYRRKLLTLLSR